jgi:hypothetical protein
MSIVAAFTGGGALINTTGLAVKYGAWAFFDVLPAVVGLSLSAILVHIGFFGKRFSARFFDIESDLYDQRAVTIHYAQIAFLYILVIAAQLRAVATVAAQLQISEWIAVAVCCATVAAYAYKGFDAVTKTDVVQLALMVPMYFIVGYLAFEPREAASLTAGMTQELMPLPLIAALCLPFVFLPISQEIHQRGAAVETDNTVSSSYWIAAAMYLVLGSVLVLSFANNPALSFAKIVSGENTLAAVLIVIGLLSAILSTMDTSTNIASHAVQKLAPFSQVHPALVQIILLALGAVLFLYFKTVLAIILFALFAYMAGPALTFIGVYGGIRPRICVWIGGTFVSIQTFFHFEGGKLLDIDAIASLLPVTDPIRMGLILLFAQMLVLLAFALKRRFT